MTARTAASTYWCAHIGLCQRAFRIVETANRRLGPMSGLIRIFNTPKQIDVLHRSPPVFAASSKIVRLVPVEGRHKLGISIACLIPPRSAFVLNSNDYFSDCPTVLSTSVSRSQSGVQFVQSMGTVRRRDIGRALGRVRYITRRVAVISKRRDSKANYSESRRHYSRLVK